MDTETVEIQEPVEKIIVFGNEIVLPQAIDGRDMSNERIESMVSDLNEDLVNKMQSEDYNFRKEGSTLVVYRGAYFG